MGQFFVKSNIERRGRGGGGVAGGGDLIVGTERHAPCAFGQTRTQKIILFGTAGFGLELGSPAVNRATFGLASLLNI